MKSTTQHQFSQVPSANIQRSTFQRDHGYKTTFNAGDLVPIFVDEVLPGDTFAVTATMFARLATPLFPIMDNLFLDSFWFFVPNRLVWSHWVNFMGEEEAPGDYVNNVVSYLTPQVTTPAGGYTEGSLADYFGIPTKINALPNVNAFAFRAYNDIWNEWFRDQNLQTKVSVAVNDGPDSAGWYAVLKRNKRHDYFTSCLPWPQKGPGVSIPLGTQAPIIGLGMAGTAAAMGNVYTTGGTNMTGLPGLNAMWGQTQTTGAIGAGNLPRVYADLTNATAATINSLRQAFQVQRLYERDARGGSRYTELVRSHFGVVSPDARLQRPEYLGGGTTRVNINPVAQTSAAASQPSPLGALAATGTAGGATGFTKSFTEHGTIIGIINVRADLTYEKGLHRSWTRRTRFDFYWPVLANLGEQSVLNQEIYAQGVPGTGLTQDQGPFGYQERWAEYRYKPSQVTGLFRSNATGTLNAWHLAQTFGALPTLNSAFMQEAPPMARVKAVTSQPDFLFDSYISVRATRPMPTYSVPGMIDHF